MLETFLTHGVMFDEIPEDKSNDAIGTCPFCFKEKYLYVNQQTYGWDCKGCGKSGYISTFLKDVFDSAVETTSKADYKRLSELRKKIPARQFKGRVAWDGNRWLIPEYSHTGNISTLKMWTEKGNILGTKGCKTGLFGDIQQIGKDNTIWILEGCWDLIALKWLFSVAEVTAVKSCMIAVPGAAVFKKEWVPLFRDKDVILAYDADRSGDEAMDKIGMDREISGETVPGILTGVCNSIKFVRWDLDAPSKYDIDLFVTNGLKKGAKIHGKSCYHSLMSMVADAPRNHPLPDVNGQRTGAKKRKGKKGSGKLLFQDVVDSYSKWYDMSHEAIIALRIIFSVVLSNNLPGDPLWFYIVAPSGGGKTTLMNPLRGIPSMCVFRSNVRKQELVSGMDRNPDPSLIPRLNGKTLIQKDMTELLSLPVYEQDAVFSIFRGAYDGYVERGFGNNLVRKYKIKFAMIAGVTVAIHGHSRAAMGERMLKFQLVPKERVDHEQMIRSAMNNVSKQDEIETNLSEVCNSFLSMKVDSAELNNRFPSWAEDRVVALVQIIEKLRTQVQRDFKGDFVEYRPQDGVATRLAVVLKKLGMLLWLTSDGKAFNEDDYEIIERVAFDTAIGWNLDIIQVMMESSEEEGMSRSDIAEIAKIPMGNINRKIEDLLLTGAITRIVKPGPVTKSSVFYSVDTRIKRLWEQANVSSIHYKRSLPIRKRIKE